VRQTAVLSADVYHTRLDGQHCPLRTYHGIFSRAEKHSEADFDEQERVKRKTSYRYYNPQETRKIVAHQKLLVHKTKNKKIFISKKN
jgi:hypothetical protein